MNQLERERIEAAVVAFGLVLFLCGFVGFTVWLFY